MRVYGPNGTSIVTGNSAPRRAATGTFSLDSEEAPRSTGGASGPRSIGGIDALLALQGVEDPAERRRRGIKRGRSALDALDALKLAFLAGTFDTAALARLVATKGILGEGTGDPGLDNVLAEIELRAEVELAKIGSPANQPK